MCLLNRGGLPPGYTLAAAQPVTGRGIGSRLASAQSGICGEGRARGLMGGRRVCVEGEVQGEGEGEGEGASGSTFARPGPFLTAKPCTILYSSMNSFLMSAL